MASDLKHARRPDRVRHGRGQGQSVAATHILDIRTYTWWKSCRPNSAMRMTSSRPSRANSRIGKIGECSGAARFSTLRILQCTSAGKNGAHLLEQIKGACLTLLKAEELIVGLRYAGRAPVTQPFGIFLGWQCWRGCPCFQAVQDERNPSLVTLGNWASRDKEGFCRRTLSRSIQSRAISVLLQTIRDGLPSFSQASEWSSGRTP